MDERDLAFVLKSVNRGRKVRGGSFLIQISRRDDTVRNVRRTNVHLMRY
jgi:hypothetical protein